MPNQSIEKKRNFLSKETANFLMMKEAKPTLLAWKVLRVFIVALGLLRT